MRSVALQEIEQHVRKHGPMYVEDLKDTFYAVEGEISFWEFDGISISQLIFSHRTKLTANLTNASTVHEPHAPVSPVNVPLGPVALVSLLYGISERIHFG